VVTTEKEDDMEGVITISLAIGIPAVVAAIRPTRLGLTLVLAVGLGYATVRLAEDLHPTQLDDLAWAAIVYGVMSALVVVGWLVGRAIRRRARPASAEPV
jgi:uncharacterized membrane protein